MREEDKPHSQQKSTGDSSIAPNIIVYIYRYRFTVYRLSKYRYRFFSQPQTLDFLRYLDLALCRFLSISSRAAAASFRHLRLFNDHASHNHPIGLSC